MGVCAIRCSTLLLAACLLAWPSLTAAQSAFDPAVNVSRTSTDSRMPHMVVDDAGTLHLAWTDDFRILYTRSVDRGQSFSTPLRVSAGFAAALRPRLAVHGSAVHLVWTQDPDDATSSQMKEVMYSRSPDGGASFTAPVNLSNSPGHSQEARIAVDSAGTVFVAWDEASPARHLVLRRSSDGGASFEAPRMLFAVAMGACAPGSPNAACTIYPGLAVSPTTGHLYLVWHDEVAGQLQVLFSRSHRPATSRTGRFTPTAPRSPWARRAASWSPGRTGRTPSTTSTTPSSSSPPTEG